MTSKIIKKASLEIAETEDTPIQIKCFLQSIEESTCHYYASDFFDIPDEESLGTIEERIQHMFEVFQTLQVSTENHCYLVFRCTPESVLYKDWKISELACAYMFMDGDLADVRVIAEQQSQLLNQILNAMHSQKAAPIT